MGVQFFVLSFDLDCVLLDTASLVQAFIGCSSHELPPALAWQTFKFIIHSQLTIPGTFHWTYIHLYSNTEETNIKQRSKLFLDYCSGKYEFMKNLLC